jgi:alpha-1,3-rhamnosyl/mannosyltransferase
MRIGINISGTYKKKKTGCAYCAISTIDAMLGLNGDLSKDDEIDFFCRLSRWKKRRYAYKPGGRNGVKWFQDPYIPFSEPSVDVIHTFGSHFPKWRKPAKVVTLFDVFSMLEEGTGWNDKVFREIKRQHYRDMAEWCDAIIAVSETTKRDFLRFFNFPEERIRVVHCGVSSAFSPDKVSERDVIARRYSLPADYVLFVGTITERKNLDRLLKAYIASDASKTHKLVVAGVVNGDSENFMKEINGKNLQDKVMCVGYVNGEDRPALYASASALLFPSLYEGFGMPVLEAMASGTPVLTSNLSATAEIGSENAVLVDPYDIDSIKDGINKIMGVSGQFTEEALKHASKFTWEDCARKTYQTYKWAAENRR